MLLVGVKEEAGWLMSRWNLTYPAEWAKLCKAVHFVYDYYADVEILMDGQAVQIDNKMEFLRLKEVSNLTVRGMSKIIGVPVMITFYNQLQAVDVNVAGMTEEFQTADYQKFNMSMGQYMDSIEIAMYR